MHLHSRSHEQAPPAAGPHTSKELKSGPTSLASAVRSPPAVHLHSHLRGYLRSPRGQVSSMPEVWDYNDVVTAAEKLYKSGNSEFESTDRVNMFERHDTFPNCQNSNSFNTLMNPRPCIPV